MMFREIIRSARPAFLCITAIGLFFATQLQAAPQDKQSYIPEHISATKSKVLKKLYNQLKQADNTEKARKIEQKIESIWMESGSSTVDILMSNAIIAQQKKHYPQCLHLLNEIVQMAPEYTEGWNRRAMVYFENENYALALLDIRHVLAIDPHNFEAINGLGQILREVGRKKAALKVFRKLLSIHPHYKGAKKMVKQLTSEIYGQDT